MGSWPHSIASAKEYGASGPHETTCDPFFFVLRKLTNVIMGATPVPERFLIVVVFHGFPSCTVPRKHHVIATSEMGPGHSTQAHLYQ